MRRFSWGWTKYKDRQPATQIVVKHVVSLDDMAHILGHYAASSISPEDGDELPTLTATAIEKIVRDLYAFRGAGLGEDIWSDELSNDWCREIEQWATEQIRQGWPEHCKNWRVPR